MPKKGELFKVLDHILLYHKERGMFSGESLSEKLGMTRTALWKYIEKLREVGFEFESRPRIGYKLVKIPDVLYPPVVRFYSGNNPPFVKSIVYFDEIDSTNDYSMKNDLPDRTLILTDSQRAGKGRKGRRWISSSGKDLTFSIVLKPSIEPFKLRFVNMWAVLSVINTLEKIVPDENFYIKWPNDVMSDNGKISGILIESVVDQDLVQKVVVGIGINVNSRRNVEDAVSISDLTGKNFLRAELLVEFLRNAEKWWQGLEKANGDSLYDIYREWRSKVGWIGEKVAVETLREVKEGILVDIDFDGAIVLESEGQKFRIFSGDVSLKRSSNQ